MQAAAFILHVADAVSMVAVTARCTMIVRIGQGGLAFEHVPGVVKHNRHDAGDLSDQKQPEQPRAEAALRVQRSQRPPLDLEVPVKLGHFVLYSETRVARYLWRCCRQATVSEAGRVLIVGKAWRVARVSLPPERNNFSTTDSGRRLMYKLDAGSQPECNAHRDHRSGSVRNARQGFSNSENTWRIGAPLVGFRTCAPNRYEPLQAGPGRAQDSMRGSRGAGDHHERMPMMLG
jgi:hypothetical protein